MLRVVSIFFIVLLQITAGGCSGDRHWHKSSRESTGLAPAPHEEQQAVIQVYASRVWGWRGWFADHTWLSVKPTDGEYYTVYEVIGWRKQGENGHVRIARDIPDRRWYGGMPKLLLDMRGEGVDALIAQVNAAAKSYPYADTYQAFPGPNSNTFIAWIAQEVPALDLDLPLRAVGKSYPLEKVSAK